MKIIFPFLYLLVCSVISSVHAQITPVNTGDIETFAQLLNAQSHVKSLGLSDLSETQFTIHWIYPDRRAARTFMKRISSYAGSQNVEIRYHWSWPDSLSSTDHSIPIVIFSSEMRWPAWFTEFNGYKIRIGSMSSDPFDGLQLDQAGTGTLDLAAQYIMDGIALDANGKIVTGSRVSYLSAEYLGLDKDFLYSKLDSILQLGLDSSAYPGAEVTIAYKGSVVYQKAVGYHTYNKVYRVRSDDMWDLASVTKVTAGVNALMTLYESDHLDLDKNLEDYFDYFRHSDKGELGLKRILTHSAGLTPYLVYYAMARKDNGDYVRNTVSGTRHGHFNYSVTDSIFISDRFSNFIYKAIKESSLKPGNKYEYSGLFFLLIPDLVKQLTGKTMDTFLDRSVFEPMGAAHTSFNPSRDYNIHSIVPTEVDHVWRNQLIHGAVHDEAAAVLGGISANAGLFSTGIDLVKMGETWRRNGQYGGKSFWSPETISTFTRCYYCDEGNRRALGFDRPPLPEHDYLSYMSPLASQESFGHSGFTGTMIWVDPTHEYTFVFLSNRVHPTRENSKLYSLNIRPDLHSVLYKSIERQKVSVE